MKLACVQKALFPVLFLSLADVSSALQYRVTDLGELPYYSQTVQATGINDAGAVCGFTNGSASTFLRDRQRGMRHLGPVFYRALGGETGGMNNLGQIVGWTQWWVDGRVTNYQPFVWSLTEGYKLLPELPGRTAGLPAAINDRGQIVGLSVGGPTKAWLWDPVTGLEDLGTLQGGSAALDINLSGTVTGYSSILVGTDYRSRAMRWTRLGGMENLGLLSGYGDSIAHGINNEGAIVGYCFKFGLPDRSFIIPPGGAMLPLRASRGAIRK